MGMAAATGGSRRQRPPIWTKIEGNKRGLIRMTPETTSVQTINFTRGVPANESFPLDEVIDSPASAMNAKGAAMLQYGPSMGFQPLREWLAGWQKVAVDRVLTGNGSLQIIE